MVSIRRRNELTKSRTKANCSWNEKKNAYVRVLDELDGGLEVLTEIDVLPFDVLALVLVLFQDEHVVVEELLQLLVCVVDAQLLKAVNLFFFVCIVWAEMKLILG